MTQRDKNIKTLAICLGTFIIILIISTTLGVLRAVSELIDFTTREDKLVTKIETIDDYSDVTKLDIELYATSLEIYKGEEFKVEKIDVSEDNLYIKKIGNRLEIKEQGSGIFHIKNIGGKIILYLPYEIELSKLSIEMGAGKLKMEEIDAYELDFKQGAGSASISKSHYEKTIIKGGAGAIEIRDSTLNNLDMNTGVGSTLIDGIISGKSEIERGVGSIDITLHGSIEDYTIDAVKGLGSIKIDGKSYNNDSVVGTGVNELEIEGGIGSISIDFKPIIRQ